MDSNQIAAVYEEVRNLSLSSFLDSELSVQGKRMGDTLRYSECPSCGTSDSKQSIKMAVIKGDKKCKCHVCGFFGDIVQVAMELWGTPNLETALRLTGKSKDTSVKVKPVKLRPVVDDAEEKRLDAERASHLKEAITKIHAACQSNKDEQACMDYLQIERSLPEDVIREAQRRNMLCFLPSDPVKAKQLLLDHVGESLLKASGLWKEGAKSPAICYRPLMFILPGFGAAEFRILGEPENEDSPKSIRYGKNIKLPYVWRVAVSSRAMVVEGFIDMLSAVALGYTGHVIGMPGTNSWTPQWFVTLAQKLEIKKWFVALDNDDEELDQVDADGKVVGKIKNPGQTWAKRLEDELANLNMLFQRKSPPAHHDINDVLKEQQRLVA